MVVLFRSFSLTVGRAISRGAAETAGTRMRNLDEITGAIIDTALQIHRDLGPGLLESVYETILARLLEQRCFRVDRQKTIRFEYKGMVFEEGLRNRGGQERGVARSSTCQAALDQSQAHEQARRSVDQLWSPTLREGLRRIVNGFEPSAASRLRVNKAVLTRELYGPPDITTE